MTTQTDTETLRSAYEQAIAYATGLKVGDDFLGVRPEADARFPDNRLAQGIFMTVALNHLPRISTEWESNKIVKVEPK